MNFHEENLHHAFVKDQLIKFGIIEFDKAWVSIKRVWASKFNERVYLATRKLGVKIN